MLALPALSTQVLVPPAPLPLFPLAVELFRSLFGEGERRWVGLLLPSFGSPPPLLFCSLHRNSDKDLLLCVDVGTGDIQLTLSQTLNITAAVIVTTPQRLSFVDVVKGLEMFNKVNIPSVAVVENMSYFEAPDTKVRHYLFGTGYTKKLQTDFGIRNSFGVPIEPQLAEKCDRGVPFVLFAPESETAKIYDQIAESLVREVARIQHGGLKLPKIDYDKEQREIIVSVEGCPEQRIKPAALRRSCRCAVCIDEMTGAKVLRDEDVSEDIQPRSIRAIGNYATQVDWSDGHSSLYPYTKFVKAWSTAESDGAPTEQLREEATVASS